ncbi:uncharacterized protein LOC143238888 isoform X2 [Tachypleus tridentatus]|uniref:uncharacterized protein LOC143238888 isoform X2 n=1 Tax=Tachypleus tridentatus TaxID=6853 RepID=UPI003FD13901
MKNKALLAAFILLACCICYSRSQKNSGIIHLLFCSRYATKEAIMKGYECLLNNLSVTERNVIELCQNQSAPGLSNVEFLNKFCNNLATRYQFDICVEKYSNCLVEHFILASRLMVRNNYIIRI